MLISCVCVHVFFFFNNVWHIEMCKNYRSASILSCGMGNFKSCVARNKIRFFIVHMNQQSSFLCCDSESYYGGYKPVPCTLKSSAAAVSSSSPNADIRLYFALKLFKAHMKWKMPHPCCYPAGSRYPLPRLFKINYIFTHFPIYFFCNVRASIKFISHTLCTLNYIWHYMIIH